MWMYTDFHLYIYIRYNVMVLQRAKGGLAVKFCQREVATGHTLPSAGTVLSYGS